MVPPDPGKAAENVQRQTSNLQRPIADILGILHKWGIHTLGQLAALDKEDLRNRLGADAVQLWERASGRANRLLKCVQPPESFEESFEFENEIETAEPLLFMLRRFLEQLTFRLSGLYLVARELTLRITFSNSCRHANTAVYEHTFKIPHPTNDVDLLFRMLQTHLENFKSEHPIVGAALTAQPIKPVSQQYGLFETALRNPQQLYETLARLTALLGSDRVGTPVLEETHRPDAFRMELFSWSSEPEGRSSNDAIRMSNDQGGRKKLNVCAVALRRFRPPAATSIFISEHRPASRPKHSHFAERLAAASSFYLAGDEQRVIPFEGAARPRRVRRHLESDKIRGQIVDQSGPFLLSGNWWDEKSWARSEWDLELEYATLIRAHESPPSQNASPTPVRLAPRTYGVGDDGTWKIDGIYD